MTKPHLSILVIVIVILIWSSGLMVECGIGVNWGTLSPHRLSPSVVVDLLKHNHIKKVKLFDADPLVLRGLMGSGLEVMVGIQNEMLMALGSSPLVADNWVHLNVSKYLVKGGVDIRYFILLYFRAISLFLNIDLQPQEQSGGIETDHNISFLRYIAVGNEPFLTSYAGQYQSYVVPALLNLQQSLARANLASYIKLVVPCNADAYESSLPSQGAFRPELTEIMTQLVSFLNSNGSPFVVNIYPFLSLYGNSDFPQDYAFFEGTSHSVTDGQNVYSNAFDGNLDTLVAALSRMGYNKCQLSLERSKSTLPGNFERHWGIFSFDGQAKYPLNMGNGLLKNAKNVEYLPSRWCIADPSRDLSGVANHVRLACSSADCTTLYYGGSCNGIGTKGNISYAFNSYYQLQKQNSKSCDFDGLGLVTFLDPSIGDCRFLVGITSSSAGTHIN
ncbi:hypothetical protein GIB67_040003, partial [Kingdonia uniflora]